MRFFVTSSGTGIGKTFITAALVRQASAMGKTVAAYKPVISGFDPFDPQDSDTGQILKSLGLPPTPDNIEHISPWRFREPLAPSMAARRENRPLDFNALVAHSRKMLAGPEEIIAIESVGGVMVPLNDTHTIMDWLEAVNIQALLVVGTYLGSISHTLTALAALQQRDIPVRAVIVNQSENSVAGTLEELRRWTDVPLIPVARNASRTNELRALLEPHAAALATGAA